MTRRPAVSVAIPTYNRAEMLGEAIASVLAQSFQDLELIVLDDGSTDATGERVRAFDDDRVTYVGLPRTGRLPRLRNLAIERARGDYLAFLDSDDLWREDRLETALEHLARRPDTGWSVCGYEEFDASGTLRTRLYEALREGRDDHTVTSLFPPLIRAEAVVYSSTVLVRRSAFERVGGFNEELTTSDFELFSRLAHAWPVVMEHRPLVRIRKHGGNASRGWRLEGFEEVIFSVERFHRLGTVSDPERAATLSRLRFNLGRMLEGEGDLEGAKREYRACLDLSPSFEPARPRLAALEGGAPSEKARATLRGSKSAEARATSKSSREAPRSGRVSRGLGGHGKSEGDRDMGSSMGSTSSDQVTLVLDRQQVLDLINALTAAVGGGSKAGLAKTGVKSGKG